jgi:uncharacterized oxidoreductase
MNISGNTILITGGGAGIGRALAEALHAKGNTIIVTGRRRAALDETVAANPGMRSFVLDMEDRAAVTAFGKTIVADHPSLNVLVNNAGIMQRENLLTDPVDLTIAEATVATNLLGPLRLTARAFDLGDDGDGSRSPRFCGTYTSEGGPHDVRALIVILNEVWKYRADF